MERLFWLHSANSASTFPAYTFLYCASNVALPLYKARFSTFPTPKIPGTPYSLATVARCPAREPVPEITPLAFDNSGAHLGDAYWTTKMAPSGNISASTSRWTKTNSPYPTPVETVSPPERSKGSATSIECSMHDDWNKGLLWRNSISLSLVIPHSMSCGQP